MANFEERLSSFLSKRWRYKNGSCSALNMAKAGFVCTNRTTAKCYYCDKELDGWEDTDDPWREHRAHAGYCPFVQKYVTVPDPDEFSTLECLQLEKERLLLKVDRKYQEARENIEKTFKETEDCLNTKAAKETRWNKYSKSKMGR